MTVLQSGTPRRRAIRYARSSRRRRTRIVILNENHVTPCQRVFGTQVARALRPLGYTVLLAETFANGSPARMANLAARGVPLIIA